MLSSVRAQIEFTIVSHVAGALHRRLYQQGNVVARGAVLAFVKALFAGTVPVDVSAFYWPWRLPPQFDGQNLNVPCGFGSVVEAYPHNATGPLTLREWRRARATRAPWTLAKSANPQVIGALLLGPGIAPTSSVISAADVPVRMIGSAWFHPPVVGTAAIVLGGAAGQAYLGTLVVTGSTLVGVSPTCGAAYVRITSGVDAGLYRARFWDNTNSRIYLHNLDGTNFVPAGGAQGTVNVLIYYRVAAYFNESGITPASQGLVTFSGAFDPGAARQSRIVRLHFEKSGSPSPTGGAHLTGSYWFSTRPWCYGSGYNVSTYGGGEDRALLDSSMVVMGATALLGAGRSAGFYGGCPGAALDPAPQRLWGCSDNGASGSIWWWLYKSPEGIHEVASGNGTPNDPPASGAINMTGARARGLVFGTDEAVYVAVGGNAQAGVVKITNALAASQWLTSASGLGTALNGISIDKTRNRATAAGTVSTAAGTGNQQVTVTGGAFTQADVGRAITLSGGSADNGTYKISAYVDATHMDVTTLAGGNVTFTGTAASGAMKIGDRLYLFWNDATSNAGSGAGFVNLRYMETEAFGTVLTTGDLAVTASTGRTLYDGHATFKGAPPAAAVDPSTGNLFWVSSDTAQRLNRFSVTARTVSQKTLAGFTAPADGAGYTTPTLAYSVAVNPHASFREVWVGTDQGIIRFSPDHADLSTLTTGVYAFALATNQYRRYFGDGITTVATQPANYSRPDSLAGTRLAGMFAFGLDGKVFVVSNVSAIGRGAYLRELDHFGYGGDNMTYVWPVAAASYTHMLMTPYGEPVFICPNSANPLLAVGGALTDYQWIGAAWVAKEAVRGVVPDATSQPGCLTKALHTTADDLLMGVKVAFAVGAGGDAVQCIGRMSQKQAQQADGAWAAGTASNWKGTNFTAADVGRLLRVESGAQAGVYLVTAYVNVTTLTVQTLARAAYNATLDAGPLNYTLWDLGTSVGAETCTVSLGNGIAPDNTQDITGISTEFYYAKTLLSDQQEAVKVAYGVPPPAGSIGIAVYHKSFLVATASTTSGTPSGAALDAGTIDPPDQVVDYIAGRLALDGANGRSTVAYDVNTLRGVDASLATGGVVTVDLGTDVEIGAVIVRLRGTAGVELTPHLHTETTNTGGMLANLHRANSAGGAPILAATGTHTRTGLTGANCAIPRTNPPTATLSTGNFLGGASVTYTDGETTQGGNTFTSAAGRFTGLAGGVVQLSSGTDLGYYRIVSVNGDGSVATIQNLGQTAKAWAASAAGLSLVLYANAAREDDILLAGAHRCTIEMLTSPTVARVRHYGGAAVTAAAWEVLVPTWALVKRLSHSTMAVPPNVANNGTYVNTDSGESGSDLLASLGGTVKAVFSLTDLTAAQRTGRWWKFSFTGRFLTSDNPSPHVLGGIEFYDTAGKRLLAGSSNYVDTLVTQPDFMRTHITRLDWIQACYAASAAVPGVNALATIGGALGDTITLAGAVAFLPLRIALGATITAPGGGAVLDITGADRAFTAADVGRIIWVQAGANAGYFRILTTPGGTQITVAAVDGSAVVLNADATPRAWSIHEGILAGAGSYDFINLGAYGEFTVKSVSADLKTITLNETTMLAAAGLTWEIRRRATPVVWDTVAAVGADAAQVARLVYSHLEAPRQPGDVSQDHLGGIAFHPADVGTPVARADGATTAATGTFDGSGFNPDDVGRMLRITAGADAGPYLISAYTSPTRVTLVNLRTGAAITFAATAGALGYTVRGEKRFRISRYVTVLRQ